MHSNGSFFTGCKGNAIKASQRPNGKLRVTLWRGSVQVNLRDIVTASFTRILHMKLHIGAPICRWTDMQSRVSKACVRKPIAKAVERLNMLLVEPAIEDIHDPELVPLIRPLRMLLDAIKFEQAAGFICKAQTATTIIQGPGRLISPIGPPRPP